MIQLSDLDVGLKQRLIEFCAKELNNCRWGNRTPYYLWAASNRREVEVILNAATVFLTDQGKAPQRNGRAAET